MTRLGVRLLTAGRALATLLRPRGGTEQPVRRILVAHYLLLGDTILLAPLLKALAHRYPDADRVVLARPAVARLFEGRPYGATALAFDRRDAASRRRVIDSGPYDLAIVPDDNRYAWLARAAGARRVVGFAHDRPAWKNWMLDRAVPYPSQPGAWADLAARGLHDDDDAWPDPPPFEAGEWPAPAATLFTLPDAPFAVLHVGASTPLKRWPSDRWRSLAERLRDAGLTIVWSGGAGERDVLDEITVDAGDVDLVGQLDLAQLWQLLARARVLVCPDTGVAHLARLVGVPAVALFGPGSSVVHGPGAFWRDARFRIATVVDFPCRDQHTLYRRDVAWVRRCGRRYEAGARPGGVDVVGVCGRPLCMEAIDGASVLEAANGWLR